MACKNTKPIVEKIADRLEKKKVKKIFKQPIKTKIIKKFC